MNAHVEIDGQKIVPGALKPRDAATLILVRRDGAEIRVLMGRRHGDSAFMAGKYVFPGGRVDAGDQRLPLANDLRPEVMAKVALGISPTRARALALAAIRETFEETGVLFGISSEKPPRTRNQAWQRFFAHGIVPKLEALDYIARAITPPNRTRRFDARFFMADADGIAHTLDAAESEELLEACWPTLRETETMDLPTVTRSVLKEVAARLHDPKRAVRPVPFFYFRRSKPMLDYV